MPERVRPRRLEVDAEAADDRRRRGRAGRRVVRRDDLAAVDQREHLARDVGLDVAAGVRVARLERALAGEHLLDHARGRRRSGAPCR